MRSFREKKTLDRFSTTYTPIFQREIYSSLVRNHCSLFCFLLVLSYIERRFVPKHNPHIFRVQRVFQSLGSFWELPKEASKAWQMQSGILQDFKSQTRHDFEKPCWSRSLEGLGIGQIRLGGSFANPCIPTDYLVDRLPLRRRWRGFSLSFLVSTLITHQRVILCLHSLFLYSCALLLMLVVHAYALEQFICLFARIYSILYLV